MPSKAPESTHARWIGRASSAWLVAVVLILGFPGAGPWAGNEKIIEERTRELEDLNKQAVEQIPDIPEDGKIDIKADGVYREGEIRFNIREYSTTSTVREGNALDSETKMETPRNEIIEFQKNTNQTTNTEGRGDEDDPEKN